MAGKLLRMPIRHRQIAQLYGPGMPPGGREGYHQKMIDKLPGQVGLVLVHCWNLGEADGPYPIKSGDRRPGEVADCVQAAQEIIRQYIKPVLDAARRAGVTVFHLAHSSYARRYWSYLQIESDPSMKVPPKPSVEGCVRPRSYQQQLKEEYGPDFPGCVWETHPDTFDIARAVRPIDSEPVFLTGGQLNSLCRRRDIDTLFYAGFQADICLIFSSGAIREMANTFRYHCVVLRECTAAYEYQDTYQDRLTTRTAIRFIETELGYSASAADFIAAADAVGSQQ